MPSAPPPTRIHTTSPIPTMPSKGSKTVTCGLCGSDVQDALCRKFNDPNTLKPIKAAARAQLERFKETGCAQSLPACCACTATNAPPGYLADTPGENAIILDPQGQPMLARDPESEVWNSANEEDFVQKRLAEDRVATQLQILTEIQLAATAHTRVAPQKEKGDRYPTSLPIHRIEGKGFGQV